MSQNLLEIQGLSVDIQAGERANRIIDDISLNIGDSETLALVGESGCGKSMTALSVLNLIPKPPANIAAGKINYSGRDLLSLNANDIRKIRGNEIAMIFQEPMTSLNPVYTIGDQISEAVLLHEGCSENEARDRAIEMLKLVKIPMPEQRFEEYPHQLSGGMRQRVMIAIALSCKPKLLIADEPTTALDVTIQAQILDLMKQLQEELKMSILLITHDLGVVAEVAHRVAVMYAGKIVETGSVREVFAKPSHPYTAGLFNSLPSLSAQAQLSPIPGVVPHAGDFPEGCRFAPRCAYQIERCSQEPPLEAKSETHAAACWVTSEDPERDLMKSGGGA